MRDVSINLDAHLQSGVTHLCWCWKIKRTDGLVLGFTDHDGDLNFDGLLWKASSGIAPGMIESSLGFETGSAGSAGSIFDDSISAKDLKTGLFNGARVEIWRVDWKDPVNKVGIWAGEIGDIQLNRDIFTAELMANTRKLERTIGRTFSKTCDAQFGDARCTKNIDISPFRSVHTIDRILSPTSFSIENLSVPKEDWLVFGKVEWLDLAKAGFHGQITSQYTTLTTSIIELLLPPAGAAEPGDQIALIAGCDKSLAHCSKRFLNVENFRGCPFMPGNDTLLATPISDQ